MRSLLATLLGLLAVLHPGAALAWGEPGHQLIGAIAAQLLESDHPAVARQVRQILGDIDLPLATTWADCARDVHQTPDGHYIYSTGKYTQPVCANFSAAETQRMTDYVARNWNNCIHSATSGCQDTYHYADIAWQRGAYGRSFVGSSDHDIVSAIDAAIVVLQGGASPAPFAIAGKREALILIAHFIGDLHQPLHLGAVYLDAQGAVIDPDATGLPLTVCDGTVRAPCTEGGNAIMLSPTENLHHSWDALPPDLTDQPTPDLVAAAKAVPATTGPIAGWAGQWASDSAHEARDHAFPGLVYVGNGDSEKPHWTVQVPAGYAQVEADDQHRQLVKAGAHLAQLLAAILGQPA